MDASLRAGLAVIAALALCGCSALPDPQSGWFADHTKDLQTVETTGATSSSSSAVPELSELVTTPMDRPLDEALSESLDLAEAEYALRLTKGALGASSSHVFAARPSAWFPQIDGSVSLDDGAGFSTGLTLDNELNLDDLEPTFSGEVNLRILRSDFWLSGFIYDSSDSNTLTQTVTFGNITFTGTTTLDATFELDNLRFAYGIAILDEGGVRVSPLVGVHYFRVSASLSAVLLGVPISESIEEDLAIPFVGARAEIAFSDFLITAEVSVFFIDVDTFEAPFVDLLGTFTWRPTPNIAIFAGYRYILFDVRSTDLGRDFSIELEIHGPIVGAELRF